MSANLALFPLPEVVLFPRTFQRFHIFETRYREMICEVMETNRRLVICQLRPGWEKDYEGAPPVSRIASSGRILDAECLPDGRWHILVEGIERIVIQEELQQEPFRIARITPFREKLDEADLPEVRELMHSVARVAESIGRQLPRLKHRLSNLVNVHQHPGIVCDVISSELVADSYARQSLLSEADVRRRLRLLSIQLDHLLSSLHSHGVEVPVPPPDTPNH
jgi:uncharacterized protein